MNKYSNKIINFINNIELDENIKNNIKSYATNISNENNIKTFYDIISKTYNKSYDIKIHKTQSINKIHELEDYPLFYLFYCKMYENGLIGKICSDFDKYYNSFYEFTRWYKKSQYKIDNYLIDIILNEHMNNCSHNNNDNKDDNKDDNNKYDELCEIYNFLYKSQTERRHIHDLIYSNNFISLDILHYIECNDLIVRNYNSDKFNLFVYDDQNSDVDINKIIHIIYIMTEINNSTKSKKIKPTITLILTKQRKQISNNDHYNDGILCQTNTNSGSSLPFHNVLIWRKEEIHKVLIHELIHFFGFDYELHNFTALNKYITNVYNVNYIDNSNESYTECFATIIHSLFISFYTKNPFDDILHNELIFTLYQVSKILSYYKINTIEELGYKIITQTTSVFSYFFIKGLLLFNIDELFSLNENIKISDKIIFFDLIKKCEKKSKHTYYAYINNMLSKKYGPNKGFVSNTMRMTCYQID